MTIKIIDRGRKEQILAGRLEFIRSMVESDMHQSQAPAHHDEAARIAELNQKFDEVRSRLTIGADADRIAKNVDSAIRQDQGQAIQAQVSLEIKKLLDLI